MHHNSYNNILIILQILDIRKYKMLGIVGFIVLFIMVSIDISASRKK